MTTGTDSETIVCPHCGVTFSDVLQVKQLLDDPDGHWSIAFTNCPAAGCKRLVLFLVDGTYKIEVYADAAIEWIDPEIGRRLLHPKSASRPLPSEVEPWFRDAYNKAALVLEDAPDASAAVSRRCLQRLLTERGSATGGDLAAQIDSVIAAGVPAYIGDVLDRVRIVGNFASHPIKARSTGEVIEVEPGEAEMNLDALELLFDHYFVRPARSAQQKAALNEKLVAAGKQPLP